MIRRPDAKCFEAPPPSSPRAAGRLNRFRMASSWYNVSRRLRLRAPLPERACSKRALSLACGCGRACGARSVPTCRASGYSVKGLWDARPKAGTRMAHDGSACGPMGNTRAFSAAREGFFAIAERFIGRLWGVGCFFIGNGKLNLVSKKCNSTTYCVKSSRLFGSVAISLPSCALVAP